MIVVVLLVAVLGCRDSDERGWRYKAVVRLRGLEKVVTRFRNREIRNPYSLDELVGAGYVKPDYIVDPWGQQYTYILVPSGYELFSNGPDRLALTSDDVLRTVHLESCELSSLDGIEWMLSGAMVPIDRRDQASMDLARIDREVSEFYDFTLNYPEALDDMDLRPGWARRRGYSTRLIDP